MKLYLISPSFDVPECGPNAIQAYLDAVVELIADAMLPTGHGGLIGVWSVNEDDVSDKPFDARYGRKHIKSIPDRETLRSALRRIADPRDDYFMWIRCLTTCRSVFFGYDGQAFLCLRYEDAAPQSSALICVEECSSMLSETDYLDG